MATITTRSGKGSPLTNSEVDSNFSDINTELSQKESASNKGVANGYASLDGSGKVPSTQLPSYVDDVVEGANLAALPATGETGKIYVTLDTNKTYRWSGSAYVEISASPGSTDAVTEGSTNLYFTNARARSAISASGSLSYNSSTGVLSYTQPTNVSTFTNDSGYITSSALSPYLTSATAASTYQTTLVSGTSIKTVNGQSVLGSGNIQIDGGVTSFNTRTGAVTLSSGDVTGALGYTPYNSTNPSGYITSSSNITGTAAGITGYTLADVTGTATSVMTRNASGDSAVGSRFHFTTCTADGGTFGLVGLNWGGAAGTYKNFEVYDYVNTRTMFKSFGETRNFEVYGALSAVGATLTSASTVSVSTWEKWTLETTGVTAKARQGSDANGLNFTSNARWTGSAWAEDDTAKKKFAYIQHLGNGRHEFRTSPTGAGVSWTTSLTIDDTAVNSTVALTQGGNQVLHAGNYTSYSPSLTGSGASGTWSINVTGSAGSASNAGYATYNQILDTRAAQYTPNNYQDYRATYEFTDRFTGLGDWHTAMTLQGWHDGYTAWQIIGPASTSAHENWYLRSGVNTSWNSLRSILHSGNYTTYSPTLTGTGASGTWAINVTGNAATATSATDSTKLPLTGGTLTGTITVGTTGSGSQARALRIVPTGTNPSSFGSYSGSWRSALEIWDNAATRMLFLAPPDGTNFNYSYIKSTDAGLLVDVGSGGGTRALTIEASGVVNAPQGLQSGGNTVLHAGNYTSYALPLSGGTMSGHLALSDNRLYLRTHGDTNHYLWNATDDWEELVAYFGTGFRIAASNGSTIASFATGGTTIHSQLNTNDVINLGYNINGSVATSARRGIELHNSGGNDYWIGKRAGVWTQPLDVSFYAGIRYHAHQAYGGHKFYTGGYDNTYSFSVGDGDSHVRVYNNLYVGGNLALHAGNYTSYSPSLTGSNASGTWAINISGSAAALNGYASSESGGGSVVLRTASNGYLNLSNWIQVASSGLFSSVNGAHWYPNNGSYGAWKADGSRNGWGGIEFPGSTTAVSLMIEPNGDTVGFHANSYGWKFRVAGGTAYVGKNYWGANEATILDSSNYTNYSPSFSSGGTFTGLWYFRSNRNTSSDSAPLQAFSNDGGGAIMSFHRGGYYATNFGLDSDNVIRIGGWSAATNRLQMDMSGNLTMAGNVTAYSDERLKKDWSPIYDGFVDRLAVIRAGTYTRIDSGERQAGVSAQAMRELLPEVVSEDNEGTLALAYGNAAMVSAVELAKELVMLKKELAEIKSRLH